MSRLQASTSPKTGFTGRLLSVNAVKYSKRHRKAANDRWSIDELVAAKQMAEKLGGIEKAREALAALSRLS